jgi:hypothetical protein
MTSSDNFVDNFGYALQLEKIRNFYGDAIFEDLISPKDHVQPLKVSIRLSSDGDFQIVSRGQEGVKGYRYNPKRFLRELLFSYKIYASRL